MTLHQFAHLDETKKIETFWKGVAVGEFTEGEFVVECRQVDDFYVEYKILDGHYIDMRSFKNPDLLQPYLDKMDINLEQLFC